MPHKGQAQASDAGGQHRGRQLALEWEPAPALGLQGELLHPQHEADYSFARAAFLALDALLGVALVAVEDVESAVDDLQRGR